MVVVTARTTPPFGILPFQRNSFIFRRFDGGGDMIVINTGNPEGNSDYWVTSSGGDSRILWGWHGGPRSSQGGGRWEKTCALTQVG